MEEFVTAISLLYSIHISGIVSLKPQKVWRIIADEGTFILKLLPYPKEETGFITDAMAYLTERGFHRHNEIILTKEKAPFGAYGESCTLLTKELFGRTPSFQAEGDVAAVAAGLGGLHRAAAGFFPRHRYAERIKWGKIPAALNSGKDDLENFAAAAAKKAEKDDFDRAFLGHCEFYIRQAEAVIAEMTPFYHSLSQRKEKCGGFCHHDPAHHNFFINEQKGQKDVFVFDFDYAIADLRAHDVAALLLKILKTNHWDCPLAQRAFAAYHDDFPLVGEEIRFIELLLKYPYDFRHAAFARYAEKNSSARIAKKLLRLTEEAAQREKALVTLNQYFAEES